MESWEIPRLRDGGDAVVRINKSSEGAGGNSSVKMSGRACFSRDGDWGPGETDLSGGRGKNGPLLLLRRLPEELAMSTCGPYQAARGADSPHNCCPV